MQIAIACNASEHASDGAQQYMNGRDSTQALEFLWRLETALVRCASH
jgi:hypothetical protein